MNPISQGDLKDWGMILSMWAFFGSALYIIATTLRRKQRNAMQQHVLDKFASAKDFADFIQSPAGQKYVMRFADTAASAKASVLNSVRLGIVLMFMGFGLQTIGPVPMRIGLLVVTIGVGFLVSAAISYVLSRKL